MLWAAIELVDSETFERLGCIKNLKLNDKVGKNNLSETNKQTKKTEKVLISLALCSYGKSHSHIGAEFL